MRYRNAPAAIEWLCQAFGFEKHLVVPGENDTIAHAQLTVGNGMMMLGSTHDNEFGKLIKQPDELGGVETQCPYVIVQDADAHYGRAMAAGAKIVKEIADAGYGGRGYSTGHRRHRAASPASSGIERHRAASSGIERHRA
jgi:uncharacterized glyoxalase superfamily protein PhnB